MLEEHKEMTMQNMTSIRKSYYKYHREANSVFVQDMDSLSSTGSTLSTSTAFDFDHVLKQTRFYKEAKAKKKRGGGGGLNRVALIDLSSEAAEVSAGPTARFTKREPEEILELRTQRQATFDASSCLTMEALENLNISNKSENNPRAAKVLKSRHPGRHPSVDLLKAKPAGEPHMLRSKSSDLREASTGSDAESVSTIKASRRRDYYYDYSSDYEAPAATDVARRARERSHHSKNETPQAISQTSTSSSTNDSFWDNSDNQSGETEITDGTDFSSAIIEWNTDVDTKPAYESTCMPDGPSPSSLLELQAEQKLLIKQFARGGYMGGLGRLSRDENDEYVAKAQFQQHKHNDFIEIKCESRRGQMTIQFPVGWISTYLGKQWGSTTSASSTSKADTPAWFSADINTKMPSKFDWVSSYDSLDGLLTKWKDERDFMLFVPCQWIAQWTSAINHIYLEWKQNPTKPRSSDERRKLRLIQELRSVSRHLDNLRFGK